MWYVVLPAIGALLVLFGLIISYIRISRAHAATPVEYRFVAFHDEPDVGETKAEFVARYADNGSLTPTTVLVTPSDLFWCTHTSRVWRRMELSCLAGSDVEKRHMDVAGHKCFVVTVDAWCRSTAAWDDTPSTSGSWVGDMMALCGAQLNRLGRAVTLGGEATQRRIRARIEFVFMPGELHNSSATAKLQATRLHRLLSLSCSPDPANLTGALCQAQKSVTYMPEDVPPRKVLLLVNPVSGNKTALSMLESLQPLMTAAKQSTHFTTIATTHYNHAREIARELQPFQFDAVVTLGGDGMLYEVLNGIMDQRNGRELLQSMALGALPAGTGNGLCCSLGVAGIEDAMLRVIHGRCRKVDVMEVRQEGNEQLGSVYGLLQISCGMMPDVDFESEVVRWMGDLRFTVVAFYRLMWLRRYPINLSCKIEAIKEIIGGKAILREVRPGSAECDMHLVENTTFLGALNTRSFAEDFVGAPTAEVDDGLLSILNFTGRMSKLQLFQSFFEMTSGSHMHSETVQFFTTKEMRLCVADYPGVPCRLDIDGEEVHIMPDAPIHIRSLPSFCSVLC